MPLLRIVHRCIIDVILVGVRGSLLESTEVLVLVGVREFLLESTEVLVLVGVREFLLESTEVQVHVHVHVFSTVGIGVLVEPVLI